MEKFSDYNDAFTGINPFINREPIKITLRKLFMFLLKLPILVLTYFGINLINFLIKINIKPVKINGLIAVNCSSVFDKFVLNSLFKNIPIFTLLEDGFFYEKTGKVKETPKTAIILVEGCNSNNKCILQFVRNIKVNYVIGLVYSPSCIYMYGSFFKFLIHFLGSKNFVRVEIKKTDNLEDLAVVTNLPKVMLGLKEKLEFMEIVKNNNLNKKN